MQSIILVLISSLFLVACHDEKRVEALEEKLNQEKSIIENIQEEIKSIKVENEALKQKIEINELVRNFEKIAYLTPGESGYTTIRFDLGTLTVSLEDIKPYANGSKVTLSFGNTLSSSINGLKGTFEWGKVDENGTPINNLAKTKEITITETLVAGSWTKVSIVLDGVPPTDFGFLRLKSFSHSGIKLLSR